MDETLSVDLGADGKISAADKLIKAYNRAIASDNNRVHVDVSKIYWFSPFTACLLAAIYDQLKAKDRTVTFKEPERDNAIHQWHNLGMSKYLGLRDEVIHLPRFPAFPITKLMESSYPLAGKVTRILSERLIEAENFHKALHFTVREIIENTFDHGETDRCYMCAYSVPTRNVVRLCIMDTGIGIPNSLRSNKYYSNDMSDIDAVKLSSELGVSGKASGRGIGLYLLRDVVEKNEGTLTLISGQARVDISGTIEDKMLRGPFSGTVVKLQLRTRKKFYFIDLAGWEAL